MNKRLILTLTISFFLVSVYAQVNMGNTTKPERATILQLKTHEATSMDNTTSKVGGLNLPRVALKDRFTLEPFIKKTEPEWVNANTSKIKERHVGLTVYNVYKSPTTEEKHNLIFIPGLYTWDGMAWKPTFQGYKFFKCPSFNLPLPWVSRQADEDFSFNVYEEYAAQYTKDQNDNFVSSDNNIELVASASLDRLYKADELDYVITHYDETVLKITKITDEGVINYRVLNHNPPPHSFINLIFVIKE